MPLTSTQLGDMVALTQRNLGKPNFVEIATDIQDFTAVNNLLKKNRIVMTGAGVQWSVKVSQAGNAIHNGLGGVDNVAIRDTMVNATADWRNTTCSYAIIGQEMAMNSGPEQIVDLVTSRRYDSMLDMAEIMESAFWGPPVVLADTLTPWGANTWIVKNATEGFNGGAPSGYTTIGLNPTTYPRWKNWTAQYTAVTKDDLIRKWKKAALFTKFKPVMDYNSPNTGDNYGFFTNHGVIGPLEEILDQSNDNLGPDIGKYAGKLMMLGRPVEWVPKLEADTTNPVYGINFGYFKTYVLKGWWLKETNIPNYPGQHTISAHFMDSTYQWITKNRRCHFVLATGVTYPS